MLRTNYVLLAKKETTEGTDPTPVGTDAVLCYDVDPAPDFEVHERSPLSGTLSPVASWVGARRTSIKFTTELRWNGNIAGSSGSPFETDPLFQACGCSVTYTAETGGGVGDGYCTIAPISSSLPSATIYLYTDGMLYKLTGARGGFALVMESGKPGMVEWEFEGIYNTPTDSASASPTYDTQVAPVFLSSAFTSAGYSGVISSAKFSLGHKITPRRSMNAATGYAGMAFTGRRPMLTFTAEADTEANHTYWARLAAATANAFTVGPVGADNGNNVKLTIGRLQYLSVKPGQQDGIMSYEVSALACRTAGTANNDEFSIRLD